MSTYQEPTNTTVVDAPPSHTAEQDLVGSLRKPDSEAAKIKLEPVTYKRFAADNPPLPASADQRYKVAATVMMRDEAPYIHQTIDTAAPWVDCFVFLDTGSKDASIAIVRKHCAELDKPCYMMEVPWIQFGPSRNHLMAFAEHIADFGVLMDASDEVRGGEHLRALVEQWDDSFEKGTVRMQWGAHSHDYPRLVRFAYQLRYAGVRHNAVVSGGGRTLDVTNSGFYLYQDRSKAKKSGKKYAEDAVALLAEHKRRPADTRTVYYLAQSYKDSGQPHLAYKYYKMRAKMSGWREERYMSHYYSGALANGYLDLGFEIAKKHFLDAFEVYASPLCAIELFRLCRDAKRPHEAHAWIVVATTLPDPDLSLQGDLWHMGPKRWFLLADSYAKIGRGQECINAYARAHSEYLHGEYTRRVNADDPPKPDSNASVFNYCWRRWGNTHPEWFVNLKDEWLSEQVRQGKQKFLHKMTAAAPATSSTSAPDATEPPHFSCERCVGDVA